MPETEIFCTECGTRLRSEPPPTERLNIDPTLIIPGPRSTGANSTPSPPPPANTTGVILKTAVATILLISVGALLAWLVLRDGRDANKTSELRADSGSRNQSENRNINESGATPPTATPYANTNTAVNRNTAATGPTPYPAPTTTPLPSNANSANGKLAYLNKSDVRLRDSASLSGTVIRDNMTYGTRLVVLGTSPKVDNVWVQSEGRYVRSTWTYVQLEDNPSIKGWVVSYVVSYR